MPVTPPTTVQVDVYFDLICPWCLIGKRQLDAALARWRAEHAGADVHVRWHSVRLIDGVPPEGWDFAAFYERRLGSPEAVQARQAQVRAAARQAGAEIDFSRIRVFPDTGPAHQLLALGARRHPDVMVLAETSSNPEWAALVPMPLPPDVPNRHLEYALTWFGLAGVLLSIYAAMLRKRLKSS